MQMREGLIVSGTGHALVIGWALLSGWLAAPPPEDTFSVTEVSVMSSAEFDALVSEAPASEVAVTPAPVAPAAETPEITVPQVEETPRPVPPEPRPAPEAPAPPQVAILTPPPRTDVQPEAPQAPTPPPADPEAPISDASPTPQAAPRVAPNAAPPSDLEAAPVVEAAPAPSETAETPPEETPPQPVAPPEASTQIVTEADQPARAPDTSVRPQRKPTPPVAVAEAPTPEPEPTPTPTPTPDPTPAPEPPADTSGGIAGAIAELQQAPAAAAAPSGPPLSSGERDGFRVAVQACWNVDPGAVWARTAVTIAFEMNRDGTPVASSLRMAGFQGGTEGDARQAYEAGRRAILRCGTRGFDLPQEKYDHWKEVEMTFDPSSMRIR